LAARAFHASRREPHLGGGQHEAAEAMAMETTLNQGGLLSMSSISQQTSAVPLTLESALDHHVGGAGGGGGGGVPDSGDESAGSCDSGRLPQRPDRRKVIRPHHVPRLDLSRVVLQADEEEEEDEEYMEEMHQGAHQADDEEAMMDMQDQAHHMLLLQQQKERLMMEQHGWAHAGEDGEEQAQQHLLRLQREKERLLMEQRGWTRAGEEGEDGDEEYDDEDDALEQYPALNSDSG